MHQGAAGLGIAEVDIDEFLVEFDNLYADVDQTPTYWVDYVWNKMEIEPSKILDIGGFTYYGQEMPESLVVIHDIALTPSMITLMGVDKGHPTLKISLGNVDMIKFKSSEEEYEEFCGENKVLTVICKCAVNEWNGRVSPQLLIENFELREEWIF